MAGIVRLNESSMQTSVSRLKSKKEELKNYINNNVQSTVNGMGSWWIGNAYESFKNDFTTTKNVLEKQVFQEIDDYILRLEVAVKEQLAQDKDNATTININ